ncbi:hypothetical protein [[Phormidium ambiguum] IAM M-71]|uniref:hypothetical protein n=1 Tax=[Phormidium ambiguum] IAM M-71 TaxID=454136 RepID=UPI0015BC34BE|nr:hypothetical protein [Phormidium ambiguum]
MKAEGKKGRRQKAEGRRQKAEGRSRKISPFPLSPFSLFPFSPVSKTNKCDRFVNV